MTATPGGIPPNPPPKTSVDGRLTQLMESLAEGGGGPKRDIFDIWSKGLTMAAAMATGAIATVVMVGATAFFIVQFLNQLVTD